MPHAAPRGATPPPTVPAGGGTLAKRERRMSDALFLMPQGKCRSSGAISDPQAEAAFQAFGRAVFADGVLPAKMKQIIAVAVAHVTQCPYCIRGHTMAALRAGAHAQGADGGDLGGLRDARRREPMPTRPWRSPRWTRRRAHQKPAAPQHEPGANPAGPTIRRSAEAGSGCWWTGSGRAG